ncbi:MAG: tetratricopeptide repeat protein [Muribaculaceae bacterium]|nr:tetratricopeptide repeat protein [Muribaculaceae bacterium]
MNRKHTSYILALLLAAGTLLSFAAKPTAGTDADKRKAEYLFLEAANAYTEARYDDYFMLLRHAAALDPEDAFIAGALAEMKLANSASDSLTMEEAYRDLERRWLANPSDENNATVFASVAKSAGRIDDVIYVWETLDSLLPDRTDPAMNLASALVARGSSRPDTNDINRALDIYNRLQKGLKGNVQLVSRKINALAAKSDTADIVSELKTLYSDAPADIQAALFIGTVYHSLSMPDSAMRFFDRACEIDSTNGLVYLTRASFFQTRGDSAAYDREVFRALESPELEFAAKFELLSDYVIKLYADSTLRGRIDHMFEVLQDVNPGEGVLHAFYGDYKATIGDLSGAAEQYSYSIDLEPDNESAWQNLTSIYGQLEDIEKMARTAQAATQRFNDTPYFPLSAAAALSQLKRTDEALLTLDTLDMSRMDDNIKSVIYSTRGDILYSVEQADSAFADYRRAIELNPKNYMAMNNAAYYMSERGTDLATAEIYASIACASDPENITYLDTQAWVFFKKKEYAKAREVMDKVLQICGIINNSTVSEDNSETKPENEPSTEIYDHAGDIYFMTGDHAEAVDFWKEALKLDPENEAIKKKVTHRAYFFE